MNKEMNENQLREMTSIITEAKKVVEQYPEKEHYFYLAYLPDINKLNINICDLTGTREEYGADVSEANFHGEVIKTVTESVREAEGLKKNSPVFVIIYAQLKKIAGLNPQDIHDTIYNAFNSSPSSDDSVH